MKGYIHIYIYIERERENIHIYIYIYIFVYVYIHTHTPPVPYAPADTNVRNVETVWDVTKFGMGIRFETVCMVMLV